MYDFSCANAYAPHVAVRDALVQERGDQALGRVAHDDKPVHHVDLGTVSVAGGDGGAKRQQHRVKATV